MANDLSFREMMERYNRELMQLQQRAQYARQSAPRPAGEAEAPPAPQAAAAPSRESKQDAPRQPAGGGEALPGCARDSGHSQTVGPAGPVLLQDTLLHETLETFVHGKELERVVHTKGYGALGHFRPYQCMAPYTGAAFLQDPAVSTPVLARFSLAVSNRGTPDSARNVHGFAVKFYTSAGVYDLVGNHIPVFFVRDAIRFPEAIAALSPSPVSNLADPGKFWHFIARNPEALHMLTWLYSDAGTIASVRRMRGYGVNTFVWRNAGGARRYVKYHWLPLAGEETLTRQEAQRLAAKDPDAAARDLYDALARGDGVEYELCVQLMDPADAGALPFDPLDDTKVWGEQGYPLMKVGRLTLERNPGDYRGQVEQAAFSPANLVEGIELSADKMLQGRSFVYWDAQRRRLGPDFRALPVNCGQGVPPHPPITSGEGEPLCGDAVRAATPRPDDFTQAGERYLSLKQEQRAHLVDNIASELCAAPERVRDCVAGYLQQANQDFGDAVRGRMEQYLAGE